MLQKILVILNSDRIHKARKAIGAGAATAAGLLVNQARTGQSLTTTDLANAVGAGVAMAIIVYLIPNRA